MLLVTPYFLSRLGSENYGQWILINSIISSLGILNLGVGDATIRYISKYKATSPNKTSIVVQTTYSFYVFIAVTSLFIAITYLTFEANFALFFSIEANPIIELLKWGSILFGIRLIEQILFSIYKGFERFDLFSKASMLSKAILIFTNITVVYFGGSLVEILQYSCVTGFLFLLIQFKFLKRLLPFFSLLPNIDKPTLREILSFGLWSWGQSIIGILSYQMDKFIVGYLAGMSVLAYYSIGFMIGSQIFNVFVAASSWVFPKVSSNNSTSKELWILYKKLQFPAIIIACIVISVFFLVKNPILELWLGEKIFRESGKFIDSYSLYILLTSITIIPAQFMLGTSNLKLLVLNSVVSILLSITFMFLGFKTFDSVGLVYGRIASAAISIPLFQILFYKALFKRGLLQVALEILISSLFFVFIFIGNTQLLIFAIVVSSAMLWNLVSRNLLVQR